MLQKFLRTKQGLINTRLVIARARNLTRGAPRPSGASSQGATWTCFLLPRRGRTSSRCSEPPGARREDMLAPVPQETFLFAVSIHENIANHGRDRDRGGGGGHAPGRWRRHIGCEWASTTAAESRR